MNHLIGSARTPDVLGLILALILVLLPMGLLLGWVLARVRAASARAERAEHRFSSLARSFSDLLVAADSEGIIRYAASSVAHRLGHPDGALLGAPLTRLLEEADARRLGLLPPHPPSSQEVTPLECRLVSGSGADVIVEVLRVVPSADDAADGVALIMREVGERRRLEDQLRRLAYTDALTGTANRVQLRERLAAVLATAPHAGAFLMLDLDDFKLVNDLYGHAHGDGLLMEAARRLESVADQFEGACLARLGGDEFALLLPEVTLQEARWVCAGLLNRLRQPVAIGAAELDVGTSIGLVMLDPDRRDVDALLRDGDLAMYAAKESGKNRWRLFEPAMHEELVERLTLEGELAVALDEGQLDVHYQPVVDLDGVRIVGVEALVRWNHPSRGLVAPDEFLPAAERGQLIHRLGAWVLRTACRQLVDWSLQDDTNGLRELAVNVSPRQLLDPHFADTVAEALADTGLDPGRLVLEITESTAMDRDLSEGILLALQALGVRLAIDDFGTGYSSLSRLALLPFHTLKIDRSFVQAVPSTGEAPLIRAMIAMAHSLGLSIVAEGIETDRQRQYLAGLGCEQGQGYLFGRPLPAAGLASLVASTPGPPSVEVVGTSGSGARPSPGLA
jgi:diguanylate cyclase (GGDEF)-like protein